jgi:hypothetical protein
MRERLYLSLLIGVLLCLAGWTAHAQLTRTPTARAWEYKIDNQNVNPYQETELNRFGSQGWELVALDNGNFVFKRPR